MPRFYGNTDYGQFLDRFLQVYGLGLQKQRYQADLERQRRQDALAQLAQERLLEEQRQSGMREKRMQDLAEAQSRREAALDQPLWETEQPPETVQPPMRPASIPGPSLRTLGLLHGAGVQYQIPSERLSQFGLTTLPPKAGKVQTGKPGDWILDAEGNPVRQIPPGPAKPSAGKALQLHTRELPGGMEAYAFEPTEGTLKSLGLYGAPKPKDTTVRDRAADVAQMNALQRQFDQQASILLRQAGLSPTENKAGELDLGALFASRALSDPRYKELNQKLANLWDSYYSKISELSGIKVDNPFREAKPDIQQTIKSLPPKGRLIPNPQGGYTYQR